MRARRTEEVRKHESSGGGLRRNALAVPDFLSDQPSGVDLGDFASDLMGFCIGFVELARVSAVDEAVEQLEEVLEVAE